jgi:hypothetical protein
MSDFSLISCESFEGVLFDDKVIVSWGEFLVVSLSPHDVSELFQVIFILKFAFSAISPLNKCIIVMHNIVKNLFNRHS